MSEQVPEHLDPDVILVRKAAESLQEHFDSVQIFANRHEGGDRGTVNVSLGLGNWFARRGHIGEWILREDEHTRSKIRQTQEGDES